MFRLIFISQVFRLSGVHRHLMMNHYCSAEHVAEPEIHCYRLAFRVLIWAQATIFPHVADARSVLVFPFLPVLDV
jgi:hypothetical protein